MKIPKKIHIIGAYGAGTSMVGKYLASLFNYSFWEADDFFWEITDPPYTVKREEAFRVKMLKKALEFNGEWVLSGSVCGWGDFIIPQVDMVVWLTLPVKMRVERLTDKVKREYGPRIEKGGDMYDGFNSLIKLAKEYDNGTTVESRAGQEAWLSKLNCNIVHIDGKTELTEIVQIIEKSLKTTAN